MDLQGTLRRRELLGHGAAAGAALAIGGLGADRAWGARRAVRRWSPDRAWRWYRSVPPIRGVNYVPRTAVNDIEMWQAETWDPRTIDEELGRAREVGLTSIRVYLQYVVWRTDPRAYRRRVAAFLRIAARHDLSTMLVLLDDVAYGGAEPVAGPQPDPVPGAHNSRWVPSPGESRVRDRSTWPSIERYVRDMVAAFGRDERVLVWDVYNEPKASSLPLVARAVAWARAERPAQPLTVGAFNYPEITLKADSVDRRLVELSDVVSFHSYFSPEQHRRGMARLRRAGRPLLCTEWMNRGTGNTFEAILPVHARFDVGWYHWGLFTGRTQTNLPWGSAPGSPPPAVWQHDLLRTDGSAYDPAELRLIRRYRPRRPRLAA